MTRAPPVLKEGYLTKRSQNSALVTNWRRRYFRLVPGELLYFEAIQDLEPRRRIPLGLDTVVNLNNDQGYSICFSIKPTPTSELFYVQAANEAEKKAWHDAIHEAARLTQDVLNKAPLLEPPPPSRPRETPSMGSTAGVLLNVKVVEAKGLLAADAGGTSDPYCVVTMLDKNGFPIKHTSQKTKVVDKNLEPVWNCDMKFGDKLDLTSVGAVRFDVIDHDNFSRDDSIGVVTVPLGFFKMSIASATSSETIDHWFHLDPPLNGARPTDKLLPIFQNERKLDERDHGELHLVMSMTGRGLPEFFRSLEARATSPTKHQLSHTLNETDNRLEVTVVAAKDLVYIDPKDPTASGQPTNAVNPMCEITLLDAKSHAAMKNEVFKTVVQFRTRSPVFPDANFVCGRVADVEHAGYLKASLFHVEAGRQNILLGSVEVDMNTVSAFKVTQWYTLLSPATPPEPVGQVKLQLALIGETRGEKQQREATKRAINAAASAKSIEQTELENAQFLMLQSMRDLDGARVSCAEQGYQIRHPKFYGVNGFLHAAHAQLIKANARHQTPEDVFQSRGHIEGYAILDLSIVGVHNLQLGDRMNQPGAGTYARIDIEPTAAVLQAKKMFKPYLTRRAKQPNKALHTHRVVQHDSDGHEINLNVGAVRNAIWGKTPLAGEVSASRQRVGRNESRMAQDQALLDDRPYLRVRVVSGHNFIAGDMNGYSDPYCTLFLTNAQDVPFEHEKKRTAVVSKTLNPVWKQEDFMFGHAIDLNDAKCLLVHVKDHNNIGRSTPLGRVEIPLQDLCQGSADTTSISTVAITKRYQLTPEPWMRKQNIHLGELCLETEVKGNATVLAKLLMRQLQLSSMSSALSLTASDTSVPDAQAMEEEESTYEAGQIMRTSSVHGNDAQWIGDRFQLQLTYPGLLSESVSQPTYRNEGFPYDVRVHVLCGRNLITCDRNSEADPFFTITPVSATGDVLHAAKRQSLTVYESRNPVWPAEEFVFGSNFDITQLSHISIHFYDRDWGELDTSVLQTLGNPLEVHNSVVVPRSHLLKLTPWGDIDVSDSHEILEYDQKVLAFRQCGDGGNYFPGRVRHYTPFPTDKYTILFEDSLDSISKIRKLMSYDAKGEIAFVRGDGTVDVKLVGDKQGDYLSRVPIRTLKPVKEFNDHVETTLGHVGKTSANKAHHARWDQVQLQVLSLTEFVLPTPECRPAAIVTLVAFPDVTGSARNDRGEVLRSTAPITTSPTSSPKGKKLWGGLGKDKGGAAAPPIPTLWTYPFPYGTATTFDVVPPVVLEKKQLEVTAAIVIRIVDQGSANEPTVDQPCLGLVKIDLAAADVGLQNWHLKIVPVDGGSPYNKFYGAVHARTDCTPRVVDDDVIVLAADALSATLRPVKRGLTEWYDELLEKEARMAAFNWKSVLFWAPDRVEEYTYLARRQALRGALTARMNRQIDNLGHALTATYRHILGALHEIDLFEEYEGLSRDDMLKFSAVHTVSAHPGSEWLNRRINDMNVYVRRKIVVDLEMQLLTLAGCKTLPELPSPDDELDTWLRHRQARQEALVPLSDFLPRERGVLLKYAACFTGQGIVSWILRRPSVLWQDGWMQFAWNELSDDESKLNWSDAELRRNAEAMQAPENREHATVWLKALFDSGFIESVSEKRDFADKSDRLFRMHGLEFERLNIREKDSTFPLDLVREIDCDTSEGELFCKKLTNHAAGFLGTMSTLTTLIGSAAETVESLVRVKAPNLTIPVVSNTLGVAQDTLWQWRYCILRPDTKYLYFYESAHATTAALAIDLSNTQTIVTYSNPKAHGPDCFEIRHPTYMMPHPTSMKLVRMTDDDLEQSCLGKVVDFKSKLVLKAQNSQVWMQAMLLAGVKVTLERRQKVLVSRLNATVLQAKCIEHSLNFTSSDLEGSFQHLMNRVFGHDKVSAQRSSDKKVKEMRARLRAELKKAAYEGGPITAKYGRSNVFDPAPTDPRKYTPGYEYAARIVSMRTPFTDATYPVKKQYLIESAPIRMKALLQRYKITTRSSWLEQPAAIRDLFLLYDVEYNNQSETVIEKHMLREDFRTMDGDLDPTKVRDKCLDLNYTFRPTDLEGCVSQFAESANGETPMGCFKIQLQSLSEQREIDWWFKLAPERGMLQRRELGTVRVHVEMRRHDKKTMLGSAALPPPLAADVDRAIVMMSKVSTVESNWFNRLKKTIASPPGSPTNRAAVAAANNKPPVLSVVQVDILEGRKLIISDIRTSDPYVVVLLVTTSDEEKSCGKTDIIPNTLNPKWKNQQFTLGKTDETHLHDKKALLLRVYDHDTYSANDPMGYLKLEFGKDDRGYIRKVKLHHSGPRGEPMTSLLDVSKNGEVEVFERLMRDTKAGQSAWAKAKGNSEDDGVLGRLRVKVKLTHHEYADEKQAAAASVGEKSTHVVKTTANHLTRFAAEVTLKLVDDAYLDALTWALVPRTTEGHVVMYDAKAEQMSHDSKKPLRDHIDVGMVCGLTYDVSRVATYDVALHHIEKGQTFLGSWVVHPGMDNTTVVVECKCTDKGTKAAPPPTVVVTLTVSFVGLNRADYIKRVLTETYQHAGLEFDARNVASLGDTAEEFLWDVWNVNVSTGLNVAGLLLAQLHKMHASAQLHWTHTPKLLFFVLHHALTNGKDRLPYRHTIPLDDVLQRWSKVLSYVAEAKSQLTGRLHGELTPRLIGTLASLCNWTDDASKSSSSNLAALHVGDAVQALVPTTLLVQPGSLVDVRWRGDKTERFYAGRVLKVYADGTADVLFSAKRDSATTLVAEGLLPQLSIGDAVYVGDATNFDDLRTANLLDHNPDRNPDGYRVVFTDDVSPVSDRPTEAWVRRDQLSTLWLRWPVVDVLPILQPQEFVRVSLDQGQAVKTAKVATVHGDGTYSVVFVEGTTATEANVPRDRLTSTSTLSLAAGVVTATHQHEPTTESYDVLMDNVWTVAASIPRESMRHHHDTITTDLYKLCAVYLVDFPCGPAGNVASTLGHLWHDINVIQIFLELPGTIAAVHRRVGLLGHTDPLTEWVDTVAPTMQGQYHGYTLGPKLGDVDKRKIMHLKNQTQEQIAWPHVVAVTVAPEPHVAIRGAVNISGASTRAFRAVMDQWKSGELGTAATRVLAHQLQQHLSWTRAMPSIRVAGISATINDKAVKDVTLTMLGSIEAAYVSTGKRLTGVKPELVTVHVQFEVVVPLATDHATAVDAATMALDEANVMTSNLSDISTLVYINSKEDGLWSVDATDALVAADDACLHASITNVSLTNPPVAALALKALDDVRLTVVTTDGVTYDVALSEDALRQECQLRHELLPFCPARVVEAPAKTATRCDVVFVDDKDAVPHSVAVADVILDNLTVQVLSARDLYTTMDREGRRQDEEIFVKVYLMTNEVPPNGGKNKLGYTVDAMGAVLSDLKDIKCPKKTTAIKAKHPNWAADKKSNEFFFGHPTIDLTHMTMLAFEVVSNTTGKTIGVHTSSIASLTAREATRTEVLYVKGDPLNKEPQGNITFRFSRETALASGSEVLARLGSARDKWIVSPMELLKQSMKFKTKHAERGLVDKLTNLLIANNAIEQEKEIQKLRRLIHLVAVQSSLKPRVTKAAESTKGALAQSSSSSMPTSLKQVQAKHVLAAGLATASSVVELVQAKGASSRLLRRKWSADYIDEDHHDSNDVDVELRSPFEVATDRLRSTLLKLHRVCTKKLLPKLDEMAAMSVAPQVPLEHAQLLLAFFEDEVEDLDHDDFHAFDKLQKRTRVIQLTQLLSDLMRAYLKISILIDQETKGHSHVARGDELVGVANIPLIDLIDRKEHNHQYSLHIDQTYRDPKDPKKTGLDRVARRGTVHVKARLTYSEVSLLETAIALLKEYKAKYIYQFEVARRRVNAAVVPAQRRRWQTLLGYLEALRVQAYGKLHWETTPTLLEHVWDIFLSHKRQMPTFLVNFGSQIHMYREVVVKVHTRWVNLQPKLNELLAIQAQSQIHATRTPQLLDEVEAEIEGLDILRSTAWVQVQGKWLALEAALEELVSMQERNKLHMGRAPLLLNFVAQKCLKGLNARHAEAVSTVQFRWVALTKHDGPINELRLMETHGLHWRRTYDLLRLLDEQCEGFSDVDETALTAVRARWTQVETWLSDFLEMQLAHKIHCQEAPLALRKFNLIKDHAAVVVSSKASHDEEGVEGLLEWYAMEESRRELIRLPYHRITTDRERDNWLAYSEHGRDSRLLITKQDMIFNPENVRAALIDRGVLPKSMPVAQFMQIHAATGAWPKVVLDEIEGIELQVEQSQPLANPERVVELFPVLEDLGKGDLLWKVKHVVNQNAELAVPESFADLLYELKKRYLATTEMEDLVKGLLNAMQKEHLLRLGINVPANASYAKVCSILVANQVKEVPLPTKTTDIQDLLMGRNMDKKGDPVFCRGVRVNTHSLGASSSLLGRLSHMLAAAGMNKDTVQLGIVDSHVEALRKQLLMEAMRKRNSLIKTFPVPSPALAEEMADVIELDMSGDYMVLVHRFHDWLVHETYCVKLAGYAALDRCARALVQAKRDQVVTKEDMAIALQPFALRLPTEAFSKDELLQAARRLPGKIKPPSDAVAKACPPNAENAKAMAYYAALRTTAQAYQKHSSFAARFDVSTQKACDAMDLELKFDTVQATALPNDKSKLTLGYVAALCDAFDMATTTSYMMADWLLGCDDTPIQLRNIRGAYYLKRLRWASAAFAIRHRWWQVGVGWCDLAAQIGVGVKVLLDELLIMSGENKMHMLNAEHLLKEINTKCYQLRPRENEALQSILWRYNENMSLLEELVQHAERCINNRKLHSERTPELLHLIQQHCVVPKGLSTRHCEAYSVVTKHWLPHSRQLEELVQMHKEGTFSIHRTPELLEAMASHTEGLAGTAEASKPVDDSTNQPLDEWSEKQLAEWRKGQRKSIMNEITPGVHLGVQDVVPLSPDEESWKELAVAAKPKPPISPFKRSVTWSFADNQGGDGRRPSLTTTAAPDQVRGATTVNEPTTGATPPLSPTKLSVRNLDNPLESTIHQLTDKHPTRKRTMSEEICTLLKEPTKWLMCAAAPPPPAATFRIPPKKFFPPQVVQEDD
ncbi:Aste57867_9547 [Aphanomyces stellatus]|uniref:Aste57867_9547 protein n=1 Tax=Aphanomyces stellatus TaxID=120398 RepID=A0A485KN92_9STRA|nr:hypothetical protein As57867_009510 [Aphanomyces stellatus]VFT86426.1 Aste57867_9547 [Aphanomyces stellatus]